mmetsp:Transcript_10272/g.31590  ORF Transcript_10272/g.31590 Transcript_10272/m.31590 type:complete len:129 (-) Transcript_10272:1362-1748(-)
MRSSCVPVSRSPPLPKTQILDAERIVERRCAMTSVVKDACRSRPSSAAWTTRSDVASSADVASSSTRSRGSLTIARAMAMRCFWPPDSMTPRAPTSVSKPSGSAWTKPSALASAAARSTSACVASALP